MSTDDTNEIHSNASPEPEPMTLEQAFLVEILKRTLPSQEKTVLVRQTEEILRLQYTEGNAWARMMNSGFVAPPPIGGGNGGGRSDGPQSLRENASPEDLANEISRRTEEFALESIASSTLDENLEAEDKKTDISLTDMQELRILTIKSTMQEMSRPEVEEYLLKTFQDYCKEKNQRRSNLKGALNKFRGAR
eukprot:CAMPEP_0184649920 /NCGR_PEP_ID=MMETSP0308-20130426/7379_1 /TAXON_ID=38269 /ORGANISM="Gloeochaete witrockiana, Strain SAG 46.84" /LENGTH=191 /DNA_ID=CAMNT_0027083043 /DNA_START=278 /DNA_END=853 /DNA_ORIENTATION=-